jgi:hypothetical protein
MSEVALFYVSYGLGFGAVIAVVTAGAWLAERWLREDDE